MRLRPFPSPSGLEVALLGCNINEENQFIDFRLITQRGKNHAFIPLCHQPQPHKYAALNPESEQSILINVE
jgi:hypothetical protein